MFLLWCLWVISPCRRCRQEVLNVCQRWFDAETTLKSNIWYFMPDNGNWIRWSCERRGTVILFLIIRKGKEPSDVQDSAHQLSQHQQCGYSVTGWPKHSNELRVKPIEAITSLQGLEFRHQFGWLKKISVRLDSLVYLYVALSRELYLSSWAYSRLHGDSAPSCITVDNTLGSLWWWPQNPQSG